MTGDRSARAGRTLAIRRDRCGAVSAALAEVAGGDQTLGRDESDHLASCLRCRVEESRYRRLLDAMRSLADAPVAVDWRLESQILDHLDLHAEDGVRSAAPRVTAKVGGLAATAAAAAGLIAYTARHRRARLAS